MGINNNCPFCLQNESFRGEVVYQDDIAFICTQKHEVLKDSYMLVPQRHVATPFKLIDEAFLHMKKLLLIAKEKLDEKNAQGYTIGWNVGEVAGQHVFHVHL